METEQQRVCQFPILPMALLGIEIYFTGRSGTWQRDLSDLNEFEPAPEERFRQGDVFPCQIGFRARWVAGAAAHRAGSKQVVPFTFLGVRMAT